MVVNERGEALKRHLVNVAEQELENIWASVAANVDKGYVLTEQDGRHVQAGVCARTVIYGVWDILEPLLVDGTETMQQAIARAIAVDAEGANEGAAAAAERGVLAWMHSKWMLAWLLPQGVVHVRGQLTPEDIEELRNRFSKTSGRRLEVLVDPDIRRGDDNVPPGDILWDHRPWWQRWRRSEERG